MILAFIEDEADASYGVRGTPAQRADCGVDVFILDHLDIMARASVASTLEDLLSQDERERCRAIGNPILRGEKIATRALVRMALSRYASCPPARWVFAYGSKGRPEVAGPVDCELYFNASNCTDMALCAVSRSHVQIGADIEKPRSGMNHLALARRLYAKAEQDVLAAASSPGEVEETFLRYWTLKESYLKALGEGLVHRLDRIAFDLPALSTGGSHGIAMKLGDGMPGDPSHWQFRQWRLESGHMVSLAVNTGGHPIDARLWRVSGIRQKGGRLEMMLT